MRREMSILNRLKHTQPTLSKAKFRVSEVILSDPEAVVNMTTAELARLAGVSDPMISRYCRTVGCKSFPDLKVQLERGLLRNGSYTSDATAPGDDSGTT